MISLLALVRAVLGLFGIVNKAGDLLHDQQLRRDGAAISQVEASNAEMDRITRAADAAGRVPVGTADPNNLDK
jgi:hypothetical protein